MLKKNIQLGGFVALIYLILGVLWILVTDELARGLADEAGLTLADIQVYKGLLFVVVSAIVIYFVTTSLYRRLVARDDHIKTLLSHDKLVMMVTSATGIIVDSSASAQKITGLNQDQLRGTRFDSLFVDHQTGLERLCANALKGGSNEFTHVNNLIHRNGFQVPVRIQGSIKRNPSGRIVYCTLLLDDLREQRQLEEERERQNQFIQTALVHLPIGVAINRMDTGERTFVNPKFEAIYGWPEEELTSVDAFFQLVFPDPSYRKEISDRILSDIESGDPSRMSWYGIRITTKSGEKRIVSAVNIPVAEQGLMISTVQDITESYEASTLLQKSKDELELLNINLVRSNKELEEFAYVASHDLQEPLRMVTQFMGILEKRYAEQLDDDALRYLGYAVGGARRMQTMLNDLLHYSRVGGQNEGFEQISLRSLIERAQEMLAMRIEQADAQITVHGHDAKIRCVPSLIERLFINLIDNALKYRSSAPPHVEISTEVEDAGMLVSVRDNGIGIDPLFAERIFIIFHRLHKKEDYEGTGIGLAVCKRIVERHRGRIWLDSDDKHSEGACFKVFLPIE